MLYSHTAELAIRATLYLAFQPPGRLSPVREIARSTGLSGPYLAKLMHRLIRAGLVRAFRGPGGGLELARPPEAITFWSIVRAMDGVAPSEWCVLGLSACSEANPCPMHRRWYPLRDAMQQLLEETTLASLAQGQRLAANSPEAIHQKEPVQPVRAKSAAAGKRRSS